MPVTQARAKPTDECEARARGADSCAVLSKGNHALLSKIADFITSSEAVRGSCAPWDRPVPQVRLGDRPGARRKNPNPRACCSTQRGSSYAATTATYLQCTHKGHLAMCHIGRCKSCIQPTTHSHSTVLSFNMLQTLNMQPDC